MMAGTGNKVHAAPAHAGSMLVLQGLVLFALLFGWSVRADALEPILVTPEQERIEITNLGAFYEGRGDNLQVETAAGLDGIAGRMSVRALTPGTNPNWIVFALRNQSTKPIERWLTAQRYNVVGSGIIWPDLDSRRLEAVTPSLGFIPERVASDRADIFRLTLEPGQTITYVAELSSERFARVYLWKPLEYELKARDRQLFNGIMLGLVGLLAIFLTSVFAANHKAIFPTTALVAWCVLAYLCVDFGFWHKLLQLRAEDNAIYRAATEAAMAASLVIFLHTFLRLGLWHGLIRMLVGAWIIAQLALIAVAVIDPRLASTFARLSFVLIGGAGMLFTIFLALRGQDRALSLIPSWLLLLVWIFAAAVILTGRLSGDVVVSGLVAGLVLIIVLLGFTVTQFAFRSSEPIFGIAPTEMQMRSLALDGAGAAVWEWNARRDELKISPHVEASLGLSPGELSTKVDDFVAHLHSADRERFRLTLWSIQERNGGNIRIDFRIRHSDNTFRWFEVEAASVPSADRRALRCVGLIRDVTDAKRAHERLLHDAVKDSLTGLPNRELLVDRLSVVMARARASQGLQPAVMFIDLDKFKSVNTRLGIIVGDSLLLTIARRLARQLADSDTLGRVGGDQFAVLMDDAQDPRELAAAAERIRRSLRAPIRIGGEDIVLTGSVGIAVYDEQHGEGPAEDLLHEAETAMYRAKRQGADRVEIFRPEMRGERDERGALEEQLRQALERNQVRVLYQPIIYLPTEELAGFEAVVRWDHPTLGAINPATILPGGEDSDLVVNLGSRVLTRAAQDAARWHKELPRPDRQLFVSVNISSRHLFRQNLIQEIRHILGRAVVPVGALKLEVAESLVMENPEQATEILEWLRGAGAELCLEQFGTGYTSLAYLQRFPFDTIKIDEAMVQLSAPDGSGSPLVRSIVALAHELGKQVVAEGVETLEDVGFLRSIGCEFAQGFYYGEPMSDREVLRLLRVIRKSERKLQRRGFFRTRTKTPTKDQPSPADGVTVVAAAGPSPGPEHDDGAGKKDGARRGLGAGWIVRPRQRAAAVPPPGPPGAAAGDAAQAGPEARPGAAPRVAAPATAAAPGGVERAPPPIPGHRPAPPHPRPAPAPIMASAASPIPGMLGPGAPHAASTDADPGDPAAAAAAHGLREPAGDTPPREARRAEPPALVPDDQGSHDQGSYGEGVPDGEMMPSLAAALANGGAEAHGVAGLDTPGAPDMAVEEFAAAHGPDGSGEEQAEGAAEATSVRDVDDATGTAPPEHADDADEASHLTVAPDTEQGLTGDGARRVSPAPTKLADSEPDEEGLVLAEGESQDEALHGGEASEVAAHTGETVGQLPLLSAALPPAPPSRSDGANGNGRHEDGTRNGSGAGPSQPEADELDEMLNLDTLPPAIAASLARLAGMKRGGQR